MLKALLKKQMAEIFRSYFYDAKTNKAKPKSKVIFSFVMYGVLMFGILGGMFSVLASQLCVPLAAIELSWLYFCIMCLISLLIGVFGSVFSTYSGLYCAKDNDLLLSMPIPVSYIMIARLLSVYLLGTMYSFMAGLPAVIFYWVEVNFSLKTVLVGLYLLLLVSAIVFVLSCTLGFVVAKISTKLKNKSLITVIVSLSFIAVYYYVYYKAQALINLILLNAAEYGAKIKGSAYFLYLFGTIGEGKLTSVLIYFAVMVAAVGLTIFVLNKSFLRIATATSAVAKKEYRAKIAKQQSPFFSLLKKEFLRFFKSPNYVMNCGLGTLFLFVIGILILIKGEDLSLLLGQNGLSESLLPLILSCGLCAIISMNDMTAPSVSLEGKSIWLVQALPLDPFMILRAKLAVQLILTLPLVLFCGLCATLTLALPVFTTLSMLAVTLLFGLFSALLGLVCGLKMPNLHWTNEIIPIKQSGSVLIAIFSGWAYAAILAALYLLISRFTDGTYAIAGFAILTAIADIILYRYIKTKGVSIFVSLS